jgi:hypothetical protein
MFEEDWGQLSHRNANCLSSSLGVEDSAYDMADFEKNNGWQVFVRSRRNSNEVDCRSTLTKPQIPEESRNLHLETSTHNLPADSHFGCTDAPTSVKSPSLATPSSVDGVFLTAPQTPAESIDLNLKSEELFSSSPGLYKSANEAKGEMTCY